MGDWKDLPNKHIRGNFIFLVTIKKTLMYKIRFTKHAENDHVNIQHHTGHLMTR